MRQDFYAVLGVSPAASADEIRQAFRQLARQFHPDANPGDPAVAEHFKVVNEAYRVLGTPQLRTAYDQALRIVRPASSVAASSTQTHIPTPPHGPISGPRTTMYPAPGGSPADTDAAPVLMAQITPAQPAIVAPHEPTRFYLLAELGATRKPAVIDPLPLDLALVVDRSMSMKGEKISEVKRGVMNLLDQLHANDLLTLVFFDNKAEVLADGETVRGRAGIEMALDGLNARGGTNIASGLEAALERLAPRQTRSRVMSLVLLSDGRTISDSERCVELAAHARDMGVSITALGLGLDWNRDLLDRIAAVSGGGSNFVERPSELQTMFDEVIMRLRATLASGMRMTFEPVPGVHIARATRIAPDIAEAFAVATDALPTLLDSSSSPVTVDLGALVGRPDIESAAVVWDLVLDPSVLVARNGAYDFGRLTAAYWAPRHGGGQMERLAHHLQIPVNMSGQPAPFAPDVRLALELITAYRLQTQADQFKTVGKVDEAVKRMRTAELRLQNVGSGNLASKAREAAQALSGAGDAGITETLRAKYDTKNHGGIFHRLRRRQAGNV
ncbi:MAG TPA: DnaJ domain-containing protein [Ktedonobacterales bacterium]|nr:DnaJ domain-containing protein [Ktedonobacterales bacterium]